MSYKGEMSATRSFRELTVWQKSMKLVAEIYQATKAFPNDELYGLTTQMRRAAVAIPSNVAEGYGRRHVKEYAQFVSIAFASGAELETQLEISLMLGYISNKEYEKIILGLDEVMRMLNKLCNVLRHGTLS